MVLEQPPSHTLTQLARISTVMEDPLLFAAFAGVPVGCAEPVVHFFFEGRHNLFRLREDALVLGLHDPDAQCSSHPKQCFAVFRLGRVGEIVDFVRVIDRVKELLLCNARSH